MTAEARGRVPLPDDAAPSDRRPAGVPPRGEAVRRLVDLVLAATGALVAAPLVLVLVPLVRLAQGRPVFFTQTRVGLNGADFRLVKFASMTDARDAAGALLPDAARVTPLGRFLRRSRLDEIPEILNILKGEMALIGPRPLIAASVARFGAAGSRRGAVRPGLTGWAQVNGNTLLNDAEKLALDLWYIDHRSATLDVVILARTLWVVLRGERRVPRSLERARRHALRRYRLG